jgi:hypothetical protein
MKLLRTVILPVFLLMVTATAAAAQGFRLTPFVGYRLFGSMTDFYGEEISVDDAMSYGFFATFMRSPLSGFEFGFSRQDSEATLSAPFQGRQTVDVKLNQWSLGAHRELPRPASAVAPFAGGYLGLSHLSSSDGDESVTRFMLGVGGGANVMPGAGRIGLRLEARTYITFAGSSGATVGCGTGGCGVGFGSQAFFQMDLLAGLNVALGARR